MKDMQNPNDIEFAKFNGDQNSEVISLFQKTFSDSEGDKEGLIISDLVSKLLSETAEADIHVFIAMLGNRIVGCSIFSTMTFNHPVKAFILSPMAVDSDYQGRGIGKALIQFSIENLKNKNVDFVFTYGDTNFYSKSGFKNVSDKKIPPPFPLEYPEGWLGQSLGNKNIDDLEGQFQCVEPLNREDLW